MDFYQYIISKIDTWCYVALGLLTRLVYEWEKDNQEKAKQFLVGLFLAISFNGMYIEYFKNDIKMLELAVPFTWVVAFLGELLIDYVFKKIIRPFMKGEIGFRDIVGIILGKNK